MVETIWGKNYPHKSTKKTVELSSSYPKHHDVSSPIMLQAACEESPLLKIDTGTTTMPSSPGSLSSSSSSSSCSVSLADNPYAHYGSTLLIIGSCYWGAVRAPGVAFVWSLCGSSMAFLIAFILPAACYIQIHKNRQQSDVKGAPMRLSNDATTDGMETMSHLPTSGCTHTTRLLTISTDIWAPAM